MWKVVEKVGRSERFSSLAQYLSMYQIGIQNYLIIKKGGTISSPSRYCIHPYISLIYPGVADGVGYNNNDNKYSSNPRSLEL